ncbi:MAG: Ig-like domain-containing protein, partial [Planctomycetales bacterium]|nr:Ig-like domain-containing protein [Planctomycetales bacterium]
MVASATIPLVLDGTCRSDELVATPSAVDLRDAFARQQLLVDLDGRDVTGQASYRSLQPEIATVDAAGYVAPVADGRTEIVVASGDKETRVQVRVDGIAAGRSVDFARDVAPILSRSACNSGGCHGKASGQNGFRLSLFGFDTAFDHEAIAKSARGRRIFPAAPDESILLKKATGSTPHGGGARFDID